MSAIREFNLGLFNKILSDSEIFSIAERFHGDRRKRKLTTPVHLWLLVYFALSCMERSMKHLLHHAWQGLFSHYPHLEDEAVVSVSALSQQNDNRDWRIFRDLFFSLYVKFRQTFGHLAPELPQGIKEVMILDGSVLDLTYSLFRFFGDANKGYNAYGVKRHRGQAKLHMVYDHIFGIPMQCHASKPNESEIEYLRKLVKKTKIPTLFLFDRGYWKYAVIDSLIRKGHYFVTRLRKHLSWKVVEKYSDTDMLVKFGSHGYPGMKHKVRLVGVEGENGMVWFCTNLYDPEQFSPEDIGLMYRKRWTIESFFRDLKHVLHVQKLHSLSPNGIKIQIYSALIAYILTKWITLEAAAKFHLNPAHISFSGAFHVYKPGSPST